jgi:hypothetical protein
MACNPNVTPALFGIHQTAPGSNLDDYPIVLVAGKAECLVPDVTD